MERPWATLFQPQQRVTGVLVIIYEEDIGRGRIYAIVFGIMVVELRDHRRAGYDGHKAPCLPQVHHVPGNDAFRATPHFVSRDIWGRVE